MIVSRLRRALRRNSYERQRADAFCRPFDSKAAHRLLLLAVDHRIPQSQLYPFHHYAAAFRDRLDCDIREVVADRYATGADEFPRDATTVCFQTRFDLPDGALQDLVARIRRHNPQARLVYLDWFAPTDLRLAARIGPLVDIYLTKHLLRDRSAYGRATFGDTNLMDHYGRSLGLDHEVQHFPLPAGFEDKLRVGPSFATADFMLPVFERGRLPAGPRPIDLHARIATQGTPWYQAMRQDSAAAVAALQGVRTVTGTGIRHDLFLREMRQSKLCFSPFGYGEVCWRDYEAVMTGAVLLKQDMSHVETDPDIFTAGQTYVPVRWDLADFADKVEWLLSDDGARARIARNAFELLRDYARSGRFVDQMAPVVTA